MNLKSVAIAVVFCIAFVGMSNAQSSEKKEKRERPTFAMLLEKMDENEDGKLSKAEVKGRLEKRFNAIDTNEDRFMSEEEFKKCASP